MCAMETLPAVGTERLILRPLRPGDAPRMAELANDRGVAANLSTMPHPYGEAQARAFLAGCADADWAESARFAIEHREAGFIGTLGFERKGAVLPELGYWLGRPYWGQGYATEAARAALVWAHRDWGRKAVAAGHFADNPASGEVLMKAGFLYTGDVEARPSAARGEAAPTRMMVWLA